MRVGITGHQRLAHPEDWQWVQNEFDSFLSQASRPLLGFTSLALGAEQHFAEAVLNHEGSFTAILPFADCELKFAEGQDRESYQQLLSQAAHIEIVKNRTSNREAYFYAGKQVVIRSEVLIAVWDGKPANGMGGTADVVTYAQQCGSQVLHLDPVNRVVKGIGYARPHPH